VNIPGRIFFRDDWLCLNGEWDFQFHSTYFIDDDSAMLDKALNGRIQVPFAYQSQLSGIGRTESFPCLWYRRSFSIKENWIEKRLTINFGAVDYQCTVWINGIKIGEHEGGHVPFRFEIPHRILHDNNVVDVKVMDLTSTSQPRGKQSWGGSFFCWYTAISGIWQSVWLEAVSDVHISSIRIDTDLEKGRIIMGVRPSDPYRECELQISAYYSKELVSQVSAQMNFPLTQLTLDINDVMEWSPENPALYDLEIKLICGGVVIDTVWSYVGFRSISLSTDGFLLNGKPYFQKLILDQGYWPDGLYTAPNDKDYINDIRIAKQMGFNGCRKHMKVEDPRFLYWADRLGFLVWSEFPAFYTFDSDSRDRFLREWLASVERDLNHPCVIAWVPFNESWGLKDVNTSKYIQQWVKQVLSCTRAVDSSRIVIDNDGWEHVDSDILGFHSYALPGEPLRSDSEAYIANNRLASNEKTMMVEDQDMPKRPIMLTEFGGIAFISQSEHSEAWGYESIPETFEAFRERYELLFDTVRKIPRLCGWVYTQLTDIEQEHNGLLHADRSPKFDVSWLRTVHDGSKGN
jgi:beta-galactosidase/beta-glucuronidase